MPNFSFLNRFRNQPQEQAPQEQAPADTTEYPGQYGTVQMPGATGPSPPLPPLSPSSKSNDSGCQWGDIRRYELTEGDRLLLNGDTLIDMIPNREDAGHLGTGYASGNQLAPWEKEPTKSYIEFIEKIYEEIKDESLIKSIDTEIGPVEVYYEYGNDRETNVAFKRRGQRGQRDLTETIDNKYLTVWNKGCGEKYERPRYGP
jgi:hypothetical protein